MFPLMATLAARSAGTFVRQIRARPAWESYRCYPVVDIWLRRIEVTGMGEG